MMRWIIFFTIALVLMDGTGMCKGLQDIDALLRAARSGDARAMCELGTAYFHGRGVLRDPLKAKCWVKQAHERGYEKAESIWNRLELWKYAGDCSLGFDEQLLPHRHSGDRFREPVTGMVFVWVPGKCFKMGCSGNGADCPRDESPARRVCPEGFWMGQYEVTQAQWMALMPGNPSRFRGDDLPVEQVSFEDAREFIDRLNRETGLEFGLPTSVQWEFACRNRGRRPAYAWGDEDFRPKANCGGCDAGPFRGRTAPVGSFPANEIGLYDMGGNVREWCRTRMDGGRRRVVRGGSLVDPVSSSRCRAGQGALPGMKTYFTGFRLVLKSLD
ncbi:MAG: SUMF1/EgtB/PvdO family nonheme iron enzyme [Desulfobacter sp.]|nr:MAG: SUMF1/EgtB/PvdO family nonheme iron enzyme [Desulfobacter sp.]